MDHELHGHHQHQEKHGPLIPPAYCYGDFSPSGHHPGMQSLEPSHELIGLQSGMEMLGIPSKHHHQNPDAWRAFFPKAGGSSGGGPAFSQASSDDLMIAPETAASAITNPWQQQQQNRMMVDDSSLRCLFPVEGSQQPPAQRLSLSLFNPEQQQQPPFHQHLSANPRDGFFSRPANLQPPDQRLFDPPTLYPHPPQSQMRGSQYLAPAQELLNEICSLGGSVRISKQQKPRGGHEWEEGGSSSSSTPNQSLKSMDLLELQKHKARLLSMLEEVDRRYTRYCDQMRSVVSAFESVAGEGAATVYSTLASKAMSRHFRSLRDGVVGRIQATRKAMGEKDPVTPGSTRGETPRLRLLDQSLRQQKALQQAGMMENHPWRPQRGLPERSVSVLRAWLFEHFLHPYPSDVDKHILARQTGLSRSQVSNWFINARVRLWKPMVEEMYVEETKEQDSRSPHAAVGYVENSSSGQPGQLQSNRSPNPNPNPSTSQLEAEEQKPAAPGQLLNDSDSLSSIINSSHRYDDGQNRPQQGHLRRPQPSVPGRAENFGVVDMDFSSPYGEGGNPGFGSGVSLTLGLQQHDGGGVSLAFSSAAQHHDFFFSRESMDGCQPVDFTITEDEAQNLPYRNLMGAQLLHDLAGG